MWNQPPEWHNIVILVCLTTIILTGIICNTKTRINQQKYDYRLSIAPEHFSYKLQKHEQDQRLTFELYGPQAAQTIRSERGSERIKTESEDYPSTGA